MSDQPKPAPTPATGVPADETQPKPGGFGAFAEVYRARWMASHPNARPRPGVTDTPAPETPDDPGRGSNGTRPPAR